MTDSEINGRGSIPIKMWEFCNLYLVRTNLQIKLTLTLRVLGGVTLGIRRPQRESNHVS